MKEPEMVVIADLITQVINNADDTRTINRIRKNVTALCRKFPVYEDIKI
jgi:glycine hydroxymethyltransferase